MRKILLIQNEQYLDRALQDVCGLMTFEQKHIGKEQQVDLLAVILLPPDAVAQLIVEQQTCDLLRFAGSASPFACDSVSVNGVWLLLTVSQPDLPHHVSRQESLSRVLRFMRYNKCLQGGSSILPVFSPEEDGRSIAEQMAYLKDEHPDFRITRSLSTHRKEDLLKTNEAAIHSRVE
jgi:hypothetical protein